MDFKYEFLAPRKEIEKNEKKYIITE